MFSTTLTDPDRSLSFTVTATAKSEIDGAGRTLIWVRVDTVDKAAIQLGKWDYEIKVTADSEPPLRRWVERHFEDELLEEGRKYLHALAEGTINADY